MPAAGQASRELATVLFTDVVDSTAQLAGTGDQVWARLLDALAAVTSSEVRRRAGELVKSTGDGALLLMPSATAAVDCAAALHSSAAQLGVVLRIGAHTGEIERRGLDVAGMAVHVAARLMGCAAPGETVISATLRALATADEVFEDRGDVRLKGVPDPVHVYSISHTTEPTAIEPPPSADVDTFRRLLDHGRFEEAADVTAELDAVALVDALVGAGGRTEFLDVDVTLVRMLRDVLDRLPQDAAVARSRISAKLAFELRGDPATATERRDLLDVATRLAEEAHDDAATSSALLATIHSLWEPGVVLDRLGAAERVIALTRRTHDLDHEVEARLARVHALVEDWRVHEAGLELATYARLAARVGRPDLKAFAASRRAMLDEISGRYDEQVLQGELAYEHALAARMPDAERLRLAHRWAFERDCGTGTEVLEVGAAMLRELASVMPGNYYEADHARGLLSLGRTTQARTELARALPSLLGSTGYRWLFAGVQAAEVAAEVGSDEACRLLYDALLPHEDRLVTMGPNFNGSVRDRLGVLDLRLGRIADAVQHLRRTVADLDAIAALPWAARSRAHLAAALRAAGDETGAAAELDQALETARALGMARFIAEVETDAPAPTAWSLRREGDDWLLEAGTERARLRGSRGLEHLSLLLANPHRDVPAEQLDGGQAPSVAQAGIPVIDRAAKEAYLRRISDIDTELEAADRRGDPTRGEQLEQERAALVSEIRSATGLGGRTRTTGASAERARVNVTRNLKRAIDQIQRDAPLAAAHLAASIRTGTLCRYEPVPGGPETWAVR